MLQIRITNKYMLKNIKKL